MNFIKQLLDRLVQEEYTNQSLNDLRFFLEKEFLKDQWNIDHFDYSQTELVSFDSEKAQKLCDGLIAVYKELQNIDLDGAFGKDIDLERLRVCINVLQKELKEI